MNDPVALCTGSEKLGRLLFADYTAPSAVSSESAVFASFGSADQLSVLKPLHCLQGRPGNIGLAISRFRAARARNIGRRYRQLSATCHAARYVLEIRARQETSLVSRWTDSRFLLEAAPLEIPTKLNAHSGRNPNGIPG